MASRFFLVTFSAFLCLAITPQSNAATACVWRVSNVKHPFYLVGSSHALAKRDYPLPAPYEEALNTSQRFLFEYNPNLDGTFSQQFSRAGKYPAGQDIRRHVHPQTYLYLVRAFRVSSLDPNSFLPYRPWAIAGLWGIRGYTDLRSALGLDNHFYAKAHKAGKEIGGLETPTEHVNVLAKMTDIESELILLDSIVRYNKKLSGGDSQTMHEAWKRGDTAGMWALNQRFRKENIGADLRLLDERNLRWYPKIIAEIKTGKPTAIVAGALHYPGPNGLISLLQKHGYKLEQL
jgi:uncharacterized protein